MNQQARIKDWIKVAERNGWRVGKIKGLELRLMCGVHGCSGHRMVNLEHLGEVPKPCDLDHPKGRSRKTFDSYAELVEELQMRRRRLGIDQIDLNDSMGMTDGYMNKLESFARVPSTTTLQLWCKALGLQLTVTPAPLPPSTLRAIEDRKAQPYEEQRALFRKERIERNAAKSAITSQ